MTLTVAIDLPDPMVQQLKSFAREHKRSVDDVVRDWVIKELPPTPSLPNEVETELAAFANLSDDVLWMLARNALGKAEQGELASLNMKARQGALTKPEIARQDELLHAYDRTMVRRAEAAHLLQVRGYNLSHANILQIP